MAESVFLIRSDSRVIVQGLTSLQISLNELNDVVRTNQPKPRNRSMPRPEIMKQTAQLFRQRVLSLAITVDNLERLLYKLPIDSSGEIKMFQTMRTDIASELNNADEIDKDADELTLMLSAPREPDRATKQAMDDIIARVTAAFDRIGKSLAQTSDEMDQAASEVVNYAERARNFYQRLYAYFNLATYFLYTLGWGLGLLSRIYTEVPIIGE